MDITTIQPYYSKSVSDVLLFEHNIQKILVTHYANFKMPSITKMISQKVKKVGYWISQIRAFKLLNLPHLSSK